jgi:hypothetical protein
VSKQAIPLVGGSSDACTTDGRHCPPPPARRCHCRVPKELIDLHGNWAATVGSATAQSSYMDAHYAFRQQAALALACWDQSNSQTLHYPLLRKRIRYDEAMRTLQDQWLQVTMPGLWALRKALQEAAPTRRITHTDVQAIQNTCDALVELHRVFVEALPLQVTRPDYPLRDCPSVRAITCSPGWAEYSERVLYLEKRSGGDVLNAMLVLQREEDLDRGTQGPGATNLARTTELLPTTHRTQAASGTAAQQLTSSAALAAEMSIPQQALLLLLLLQQGTCMPGMLGMPGMPPVALAAGMPHASLAAVPMQAAQAALPWARLQHDISTLSQQHTYRAAPAAAAAAAAGYQQHMQHASRRCKPRAPEQFEFEGHETCSELYNLFQHGINGSRSWRQKKEDVQAQGFALLDKDRKRYSKFEPIVKAVDFAMQHSGPGTAGPGQHAAAAGITAARLVKHGRWLCIRAEPGHAGEGAGTAGGEWRRAAAARRVQAEGNGGPWQQHDDQRGPGRHCLGLHPVCCSAPSVPTAGQGAVV